METNGLGYHLQAHVPVRMRDGVHLATTVFVPEGRGPFSTILVRTAYNRIGMAGSGPFFARHGYVFVSQDCRGRYCSEGDYYPFINEGADGEDTLDWIARQPWSDGRVGMFGPSYLAATQFLLAPRRSPHLQALIPCFMTGDCWKRAYYNDGAFSLALTYTWLCFEVQGRSSHAQLLPSYDLPRLLSHRPLIDMDRAAGLPEIPYWRDYVRHWHYDDFWRTISIRRHYDAFQMPVLLVGGWYDYYATETFVNYRGMLQAGNRDCRVLIGPWTHGFNSSSRLGEIDFGSESVLNANEVYLDFFDGVFREKAISTHAPIRIFVMGANRWRDEDQWPPARVRYRRLFLRSDGSANSLVGDGRLTFEPPGEESVDSYLFDPDRPVPTLGGNHSVGTYNPGVYEMAPPGPYDQRPIERRDDVLVYTSEPLPEDLEVTGPVLLKLYAASSAPDTDFVARLVDVHPDGRAINIAEGVIRARFRERRWDAASLIQPGEVYEYEIDLGATSNVFLRGHCVRLDLTSSSWPLLDVNTNTGGDPATETRTVQARQTVWHTAARASHLHLPTIPASGG